jgi:DNA polymerase I
LQNIPIKSELGRAIRKAFVAEKGNVLMAFDYSQIELRIAAFLSKDEKLLDIFRTGRDVHTEVAAPVFKVPAAEVTKEMRRRAKVINFGILYGMGVNALRQNLGTDRATAQQFYNDYFATFTTLAQYLDGVRADAERKGYTETFFGRRRYFEGLRSKLPYIKASAERMAINAPIQGTGADILKLAMVKVNEELHKQKLTTDVSLILQIHDEVVYEATKDSASKAAALIMRAMESVVTPEETEGVALKVEGAQGPNYGELVDIK